jgi:uncharacterized membrane protein YphA (DoxX/SURF4 family)
MSEIATATSWLLAAVLAWAGVAKLRRPGRTAAGFTRLKVPAPRIAAVAVPVVELAAAVVLLARPRAGAVAALALLVGLTAFAATRLAQGLDVSCGCFGGAREEPLTIAVLVRNGLLVTAAAVAAIAADVRPTVPGLEAVLVVGSAAAIGAVTVALVELRAATGRLWDNRLPTGPEGLA